MGGPRKMVLLYQPTGAGWERLDLVARIDLVASAALVSAAPQGRPKQEGPFSVPPTSSPNKRASSIDRCGLGEDLLDGEDRLGGECSSGFCGAGLCCRFDPIRPIEGCGESGCWGYHCCVGVGSAAVGPAGAG